MQLSFSGIFELVFWWLWVIEWLWVIHTIYEHKKI